MQASGQGALYLIGVVLQEALFLSLLGFGPALLLSYFLYDYLGTLTGLPLFLTVGRVGLVLALATGMCIVSGLISLGKVIRTDPAEVF